MGTSGYVNMRDVRERNSVYIVRSAWVRPESRVYIIITVINHEHIHLHVVECRS